MDGDGEITQEEAMQYIRKQGIDLDENAVAMIFEGADSNGGEAECLRASRRSSLKTCAVGKAKALQRISDRNL